METLSLFDPPPSPPPHEPARAASAPAPAVAASPEPAGPALLAVDGNGLAHRAFHGYAHAARDAVHGFAAMLCTLVEDTTPDAVVVGFDGPPDASQRRQHFPAYKAHRPDTDPGIRQLLVDAAAWLAACGVTVIEADAWEADDGVASAARAAEDAGWRCLVASSDRDAYGVVSERTTVLDFRRGVRAVESVTPRRLRRKPGVAPDQYVEYAALRGDPSDNLAGVPGIGPRRAADLLRAFPTVDDAAADELGLRSVLGAELATALLADLAAGSPGSAFRRNVALMTPCRDLPVDVAACQPAQPAEAVAGACAAAGLQALAGRAAVALGAG